MQRAGDPAGASWQWPKEPQEGSSTPLRGRNSDSVDLWQRTWSTTGVWAGLQFFLHFLLWSSLTPRFTSEPKLSFLPPEYLLTTRICIDLFQSVSGSLFAWKNWSYFASSCSWSVGRAIMMVLAKIYVHLTPLCSRSLCYLFISMPSCLTDSEK